VIPLAVSGGNAVRSRAGAPFAWLDDEVNRQDRFYRERLPQPHLVRRVQPHLGMTAADFAALRTWAAENPL
jgi:hypothetical protein